MLIKNIVKYLVLIKLTLLGSCVYAGTWEYTTKVDRMTSDVSKKAEIKSENVFDYQDPLTGTTQVHLWVYEATNGGASRVVGSTNALGIECLEKRKKCTVNVRFDDEKASLFAINIKHAIGGLFVISDAETIRFLAGARRAKTILMELRTPDAGRQVIEFIAEKPLVWKVTSGSARKN